MKLFCNMIYSIAILSETSTLNSVANRMDPKINFIREREEK